MDSINARRAKRKKSTSAWKRIPAGQSTFLLRDTPSIATEDLIWCPLCETHRPVSAFRSGHTTFCLICERAYRNGYANTHYTRRDQRERSLRAHYGITHADYDAILAAQAGVCAACGLPETSTDPRTQQTRYLSVDHDHATGQVRALLCNGCNAALGCLCEDPARIRALLIYAERLQALRAA